MSLPRSNPRPHLTGGKNECPSCLKLFRSTFSFEIHRTGQIGVDRRCMTTAEMLAKGMLTNASSCWVSEAMPSAALAAVAVDQGDQGDHADDHEQPDEATA